MSRLEEIKARKEAATPGPWEHDGAGSIAIPQEGVGDEWWADVANTVSGSGNYLADAEFIANAPEDIAYLVAEVERLEATVKAVRVLVPEWKAPWVNGGWCFWCSGPIPEHFDRCSYVVAQATLTEKEEA